MQIECPNCSARYLVPDDRIGPEGRRVRCARCAHVWRTDPASPDAIAIAAAEASAAAAAAAAPDPETIRVEPLPRNRLPAPRERQPRRFGLLGWAAFLVTASAIVVALFTWRDKVIDAWPPAVMAYEAVDGVVGSVFGPSDVALLAIEDYKLELVGEGDSAEIELRGVVVNPTDAPVPAPYVRIRLRDKNGKIVRDKRELAGEGPIAAGERRPFELKVEDPKDIDSADFPILEPAP